MVARQKARDGGNCHNIKKSLVNKHLGSIYDEEINNNYLSNVIIPKSHSLSKHIFFIDITVRSIIADPDIS